MPIQDKVSDQNSRHFRERKNRNRKCEESIFRIETISKVVRKSKLSFARKTLEKHRKYSKSVLFSFPKEPESPRYFHFWTDRMANWPWWPRCLEFVTEFVRKLLQKWRNQLKIILKKILSSIEQIRWLLTNPLVQLPSRKNFTFNRKKKF